jgi:PAS domain S-box-containing protein
MSIFSLLSFFTASIVLYLGLRTLLNDRSNKINVMFLLFCLSMFTQTFSFAFAYLMDGKSRISIAMSFAYIGIYSFLPTLLLFISAITETTMKKWMIVLNFLPFFAFMFANFFGFSLFSDFIKYRSMTVALVNTNVYFFYLFYIIIYLFACSFILLRWRRKTESNKKRLYSRLLFVFLISTFVISQIFSLIMPIFKIFEYQFVAVILILVFILELYFMISKFNFLNLNYSFLAEEILYNINEIVLLLDHNFKIVNVNHKFTETFFSNIEKVKEKPFLDLIEQKYELTDIMNDLKDSKIKNVRTMIYYKKDDDNIITDTYISSIKDKYKDLSGFLIISSEIREIKQFRNYFKITNREMEIIKFLISGLTYKLIAERLHITEKTVESHITNIYNKLGINNKIELIKVTGDFNIKPN